MSERPLQVAALTLGPHAARAVQSGEAQGKIEAVFASVFYVRFGRALIAVAAKTIAPGPLTITTGATINWQKLGLTTGKTVLLSRGLLIIPGQATIDIDAADLWQPVNQLPENHDVQRAMARLDATDLNPPTDGYGHTVKASSPKPPEMEQASVWTRAVLSHLPADARALYLLFGRGQGLTPAGDDVLGGMMIALHHLGHGSVANALWKTLESQAQSRTNAISCALLKAASDGLGSAPLHHALNALTDPKAKNLSKTLATLDEIGHSSGWDAFAGIVLVMRAKAAVSTQIAA